MVNVFGYYGHNNAGDEAFKLVFDQIFEDHEVNYITRTEDLACPSRPLVVGGGALLSDYFLRRIANAPNIHIVGCSLPFGDADCTRVTAIAGQVRTLLIRSHADVAALRKADLPAEFMPDIVFALDRTPEPLPPGVIKNWTALAPRNYGRHLQTAIICLSDDYQVVFSEAKPENFVRIEAFKNDLAKTLDTIAEKFNLLFLPFSVWYSARDYLFAHDVVRRMKRRDLALAVEKVLSPEQIMDVIAGTEGIVISMKYHGLVFGLAAGRFCINIGSTRKNRDLMVDAGLDGLSFPYERLTAPRLINAVEKHQEARLLDQVATLRTEWRAEARDKLRTFAHAFQEEEEAVA